MVDPDDGAPLESRPPRLEDLLKICGALNASGSKYIVIGGMAVIQAGFVRATEDIDLLIDASPENVERTRNALSVPPAKRVWLSARSPTRLLSDGAGNHETRRINHAWTFAPGLVSPPSLPSPS